MPSTSPATHPDIPATADRFNRYAWWLAIVLVAVNAILTLPEILTERIYPWDDALYAANGTFFLTLFQNLPAVVADPMVWMTEYYRQYPALFVRRQPPLFGIVESGVYGILGVSAIAAKLTVFLFSTLFIVGWFLAVKTWTHRVSVAFLTGLLTLSLPMAVQLNTAIRPDIPALALFVWALYFLRIFQDRGRIGLAAALFISMLLAGSLYTYQLPMFGVIALFIYWGISDWPNNLKRRDIYLLAGIFSVLMIPLIIFTLKFAYDNVAGVVGQTVKDFEVFTPVNSKLDPRYWLYYVDMAWNLYRLPAIGLILWLVTKWRFPIRKWEMFILIWILVAYLGFSLFPSKGDRYAFYFMLPVLPLATVAIVDLWALVGRSRTVTLFRSLLVGTFVAAIVWNITNISSAQSPLTTGFDGVAREVTSKFGSGNILYHGRLESAFIYYVRKEDQMRQFRVLRSGNEINANEDLSEFLKKSPIDLIVMQEDTSRKGSGYAEVYQPIHQKLQQILSAEDSAYQPWREFKIQYGLPGVESDVSLLVYTRKKMGEAH